MTKNRQNYSIAITGGIASGKTTLGKTIKKSGFPLIIADEIVNNILKNDKQIKKQLLKYFGIKVIKNNKINKKKLGNLVFKSPKNRRKIEKIIHPKVHKTWIKFYQEKKKQGKKIIFYEIPLLFEKKLEKNFDFIILVYCHKKQQIIRLKKRNNLTFKEINQRLNSQIPLKNKIKKSNYVIYNIKDKKYLREQNKKMLKEIFNLFK